MSSSATLAAIFDMDGVLIDSQEAHYQSWLAVADQTGRTMTREEFVHTFGHTSRQVIAEVWPERGFSPEQVAAIDRQKEEAFRRILAQNFPAMPGARALLEALAAEGFALAVGSSGPPENVALTIEQLGIGPLLGAVVTGTDVTHGKPDPEVFRKAGEKLGVPPSRCVVIEDAPDGVKAGRAAGMAVVGMTSSGRPRELLSQANLIVDSLQELSPARLRSVILGSPA